MTAPGAIRALVVDDHPAFREGLAGLLAAMDGIEVVGTAANGAEAIAAVDELGPDVAVMDLHMPVLNGVEATARIAASHPEVAVLVLTMLDDDASLFSALSAGARGYLLKEATPDEIERAIRAVVDGNLLLAEPAAGRVLHALSSSSVPAGIVQPFPTLTARESEILDLVAQGLSNPAIAERMFLSEKTVRNYVSMIFAKIHVSDRAAAIATARDAGFGVDRSRGRMPGRPPSPPSQTSST